MKPKSHEERQLRGRRSKDRDPLQRNIIAVFVFLLFFATNAFAYLDPGTGSILLQGLIAAVAAVVGYIGLFWHKVKAFVQKLRGNSPASGGDDASREDQAS